MVSARQVCFGRRQGHKHWLWHLALRQQLNAALVGLSKTQTNIHRNKTDKTCIASRSSALNVICWYSQILMRVFFCAWNAIKHMFVNHPAASAGILSPSEVADAVGLPHFGSHAL